MTTIPELRSLPHRWIVKLQFPLLLTFIMTACLDGAANMKIDRFFDEGPVRELAKAAAKGKTDLVIKLVQQGIDPNAVGHEGMTPLWWAFAANNIKGMQALMQNGADPDYTEDGVTMLETAAGGNHAELIPILVKGGADVNKRDINGRTPAFMALYGELPENIEILHQYGADLNMLDRCSGSLLDLSLRVRSHDIAMWLIEQGADVNVMDKNGGTPAWEIHDSLTNNLYSDWARESALKIKVMLEERGAKFPPLSPEENREKYIPDWEPCRI